MLKKSARSDRMARLSPWPPLSWWLLVLAVFAIPFAALAVLTDDRSTGQAAPNEPDAALWAEENAGPAREIGSGTATSASGAAVAWRLTKTEYADAGRWGRALPSCRTTVSPPCACQSRQGGAETPSLGASGNPSGVGEYALTVEFATAREGAAGRRSPPADGGVVSVEGEAVTWTVTSPRTFSVD
ncbi:hypothetical protein KSP35_14155 [Aquihabitans sp. G128]|uniref:hypothetical protein n=1 Tax=Aquihabitans sp. G128 TaxID=2849779 RepID=UPI001C21E0C7|nr:hypothetical protein [Aquihabitans sp. G128]QXC59527.1 hypothetical protein KSP35_14155 [Aquihabitans sp. G128]